MPVTTKPTFKSKQKKKRNAFSRRTCRDVFASHIRGNDNGWHRCWHLMKAAMLARSMDMHAVSRRQQREGWWLGVMIFGGGWKEICLSSCQRKLWNLEKAWKLANSPPKTVLESDGYPAKLLSADIPCDGEECSSSSLIYFSVFYYYYFLR
ncbi:hypothetical protein SLA2020_283290 [Shorea laevis]